MDCLPDKISQFDFFFVSVIPKECSFRIKKNEGEKKKSTLKHQQFGKGEIEQWCGKLHLFFCVYNSFFLDTQETLDLLQGCNFILLSKTAGNAQRPFLRKTRTITLYHVLF